MQFLYAVHAQVIAAFCAFAHGFAAGDGGVLRHALGEGGAADAVAVGNGLCRAADSVDYQRDFTVLIASTMCGRPSCTLFTACTMMPCFQVSAVPRVAQTP